MTGVVEPSGLRRKPRFIDLFCGAGLLSHAFKASGFKPELAIDLDRKAIKSYQRNVSRAAIVGDASYVLPNLSVDLIVAGPPCQGFSTLGRRDPKDARNALGLCVLDWATEYLPKVVVVENVPGFVDTIWFNRLSEGLEELGYETDVFILEATDYGAGQRRSRAFTVASRIGSVEKPTPRKSSARTFHDVVQKRPICPGDPMHIWPEPSELAKDRFQAIPPLGGKKDLMLARPDLCPSSWAKIPGEATDVWGRIDPSVPSNTIRCSFLNPSKGKYIHPEEDRVLSLREGARLQGIPDSWIMFGEPSPIARQIGNGVPIPLGRAIAKTVKQAFDGFERGVLSYSSAA